MKSESRIALEGSSLPLPEEDQLINREETHLHPTVYLVRETFEEGVLKLQQFANEYGLTMTYERPTNPRRDRQGKPIYRNDVKLSGSVEKFEEAFGVKLYQFQTPANSHTLPVTKYLAHYNDISLPASLHPYIMAVLGLDNRPLFRNKKAIFLSTT